MRRFILAIDPGLATFAVARFLSVPGGDDVLQSLHFTRTKETKGVSAAGDLRRRAREIHQELVPLVENDARIIVAEQFTYLRGAKPTGMLSRAWGIIESVAARFEVPIAEIGSQEVKLAVTGTKTADKKEVEQHLWRIYPDARQKILQFKPADREHVTDAIAIYYACRTHDAVQALR